MLVSFLHRLSRLNINKKNTKKMGHRRQKCLNIGSLISVAVQDTTKAKSMQLPSEWRRQMLQEGSEPSLGFHSFNYSHLPSLSVPYSEHPILFSSPVHRNKA